MPLPEQIAVKYAEDDAGFLSVRPVVNQPFRLNELVDMVVRVVGKDAEKVRRIFRTGTVLYNGYRYRWEPLEAGLTEFAALVAGFPEDEPSRAFEAAKVTAILFESGGGTQRNQVEITEKEAGEKRLFGKKSAWDVLLTYAGKNAPHYEKYSHALQADLYRLALSFEQGQHLLAEALEAAPRTLKAKWSKLRPPSVLTFVSPR